MLRSINRHATLILAAGLLAVGCSKEDPQPVTPEVPTTYNFENVDYSGQQQRIEMLNMLINKVKTANDGQTQVTASELTDIYENRINLLDTDKSLSSKTNETAKDGIYALFNQVETLSGNPDNVVGGYLVTPEGIEPAQVIAKGLMGSVLYWQATAVYLGDEKMAADNTTVTEGKGTAMQHHWDEAFGYFGVPTDFPENDGTAEGATGANKAWFWGSYANQRADQVDIRQDIMDAFIKGRAAINNNDLATRNEAIATIREKWDLLVAANVVHYINTSMQYKGNSNDTGKYYHNWSEGKAFALGLRYNPDSKISSEKFTELHALLGNNPQEVSTENLQQANLLLQEAYGFTDAQMINL